MKRPLLVIVTVFVLGLSACSDNPKQLYETAQFEEVQNNHEHARKLYDRIVRDHANSEYAAKARERLAALPAAE